MRRKGVDAGVSASDIGSLDMDALIQDMNVWLGHGAERLCLSDHMSSVSPEAARWLIRYLRKGMKREIPIVYHPHNRYGLGTAAAIAVASAGGWPETTVNGFADNGLASFEEVVVALETLYGVDTGIKLGRLQELSRAVERITGFKSHPLKPVVGDAMWAPAGSYQYAELRGEGRGCVDSHMSPFEAKMVGAEVNWKWSINTVAPESLEIKLTQLALSHSANDVAAVRSALLKDLAAKDQFPAWLSDAEVDQVCRQVLGKGKR